MDKEEKSVAIYHIVRGNENLVESTQILWKLIKNSQKRHPSKPRSLYLDIEGHKNESGGFDADMLYLQNKFILKFAMKYLTEISIPLVSCKNCDLQKNNLPDVVPIETDGADVFLI